MVSMYCDVSTQQDCTCAVAKIFANFESAKKVVSLRQNRHDYFFYFSPFGTSKHLQSKNRAPQLAILQPILLLHLLAIVRKAQKIQKAQKITQRNQVQVRERFYFYFEMNALHMFSGTSRNEFPNSEFSNQLVDCLKYFLDEQILNSFFRAVSSSIVQLLCLPIEIPVV